MFLTLFLLIIFFMIDTKNRICLYKIIEKRMDGHFSNLQRLLKNGQKSDSFAAQFVQHFNSTTSRTELRKCMTFKLIKLLNLIGAMKTFRKPNCNLCMQER